MTSHDDMTRALVKLLESGGRPPCSDGSDAWLSEDREERAIAARLCVPCPLLVLCASAAEVTRATFGVWAGVDLTSMRPSKRRTGRGSENLYTAHTCDPAPDDFRSRAPESIQLSQEEPANA